MPKKKTQATGKSRSKKQPGNPPPPPHANPVPQDASLREDAIIDEESFDRLLEGVFWHGVFQRSLEEHGFLDVEVTPASQTRTYAVRMRRGNQVVDAAGVEQLIRDIVSAMPATPKDGITWHVELCLALVDDANIAAKFEVAYLEPARAVNA